MKLSFCAIVKNEEAALPSCLGSVKDIVDEMVVLDMGSSDRTPEIAQEFGAKVYHFEWCNDFAIARNEALKYVTGDWILVLDADEVLVPEIVPLLQEAMQGDRYVLVNLIRQELGASQSPYSLVSRLFRHHPDIYFSHPYHAMVDDSVAQLLEKQPKKWQVADLSQVAIKHYGYQPEAIAALDKFTRTKLSMEGYLKSHPDDPYTCSKLGALYVETGDIHRGIQMLELGLRGIPNSGKTKGRQAPILYEIHYHLGIAYARQQRLSKAKFHYKTAIEQPILPLLKLGAYNNLGNLMLETGDLTAAKIAYETALQIDSTLAAAHYNLGIALKQKGRFKEAIASYQRAIQLNPHYAEAYQNLGVVLLKVGSVLESMDAFKDAIALYDQRQSTAGRDLRQNLQQMGFQV